MRRKPKKPDYDAPDKGSWDGCVMLGIFYCSEKGQAVPTGLSRRMAPGRLPGKPERNAVPAKGDIMAIARAGNRLPASAHEYHILSVHTAVPSKVNIILLGSHQFPASEPPGNFFPGSRLRPFIRDEDLTVTDPFPVFCKLPEIAALVPGVTHQAMHPGIQNPVSLSACFRARGTCGVSLSRTGRSCDDRICCIGNISHCGGIQNRRLFYLPRIIIR